MGKRTEYNKKYYAERKEYFKEKQKQWRYKNSEHLKELKKQSYQRNRKKALATVKRYRKKNRKKILQQWRDKYIQNPDFFKERRIKYKYGMTFEDKEKIYQQQEGKCKICQYDFSITQLHIDHNHKTNRIRGLLCPKCNTSLGLLNENIDTLINMIKYLESN